jgi:hypothetical protein
MFTGMWHDRMAGKISGDPYIPSLNLNISLDLAY